MKSILFLIKSGSYSERRLRTYSFYLLNENKKAETAFIKKQYGTGGQSHALSGADNSYANYDGKGLVLARGNYGNPKVSILLFWDKVANRIAYLIKMGSSFNQMIMFICRNTNGNIWQAMSFGFTTVCRKRWTDRLPMIFLGETKERNSRCVKRTN